MPTYKDRAKGKANSQDRGRAYYETSSPFETFIPDGGGPKTFKGYTDETVDVSSKLGNDIASSVVKGQVNAEQYDNPRGYPGLAMVCFGDEKSKLPMGGSRHTIDHAMEGQAKLARTGK